MLRFENEILDFNILEEIVNLSFVCLFKANPVLNLEEKTVLKIPLLVASCEDLANLV